MNQNCSDFVSDVAKVYLLPASKQSYQVPGTVKMKTISTSLMGAGSIASLLLQKPCFTISEAEASDLSKPHTYLMQEQPQVKVTSKKSIRGNIFTLTATLSVQNPSESDENEINALSEYQDFDVVLYFSDGVYRLFRSLDNTSYIQIEDNTKSERGLSLKFSAQSVSSLILIK